MEENRISFQDYTIVACGTMKLELNFLKETVFLYARRILYTKPGRHEVPLITHEISLNRFKNLLLDIVQSTNPKKREKNE